MEMRSGVLVGLVGMFVVVEEALPFYVLCCVGDWGGTEEWC